MNCSDRSVNPIPGSKALRVSASAPCGSSQERAQTTTDSGTNEKRQPTPVPSDDEDLDYFQELSIGRKNRKGTKRMAGGQDSDWGKW
jgi:hypothetical protein